MLAKPAAGLAAIAVCAAALALPAATRAQSATPSPAPPDAVSAGASLIDFYTADRSAAPTHDQLELRLRDDGTAWLVTAPVAAPTPGRFETGTWRPLADGVSVTLNSTATVIHGAPPSDEHAENRVLTFAFAACGLTLVTVAPAEPGVSGSVAFAKRHCR